MKSKVLRSLYVATVILIVAVLIAAVILGLFSEESRVGAAVLFAYLSLIFVCLPLIVIFLALNLWAFVADKSRRLSYGLIIVCLCVWIAWSIREYLILPLP